MKLLFKFCFCPEKDSKKLLTIDLKSPMSVGTLEGWKFFLYFDSILEIKDVVIKIYGFHKCKVRFKHILSSLIDSNSVSHCHINVPAVIVDISHYQEFLINITATELHHVLNFGKDA